MSSCDSCGADLFWARTVNGRPMPLDLEPTPAGNVIVAGGVAHVLGVGSLELLEAQETGRTLWMPHHATCPQGPAWRRRRATG